LLCQGHSAACHRAANSPGAPGSPPLKHPQQVGTALVLAWCLTIHSSRSRFAARLNSGVRPMTKSLLGLFLLSLMSCSITPLTESSCSAKGGEMVAYTMLKQTCQWPTSDAGKPCSDNRDCQGLCELPDSAYTVPAPSPDALGVSVQGTPLRRIPDIGTPVAGVCSAQQIEIRTPNCGAYVANGKVALADCAD
jgi:hypothetical protein